MTIDTFYHADPVNHRVIQTWLFGELPTWQQATWQYFTEHFPNLPHAILLAGNAGTGKRAFVYRFVAWALCQQKPEQTFAPACGHCESCQWLLANTHPNLLKLPDNSSEIDNKKSKKLLDESPTQHANITIKIDEIREIQPFVQQSSDGVRFLIIHQAENMTIGASNAFLKTLEEPAPNVLIFLLSDFPSQLLPTIRSRLQVFTVSQITDEQSLTFMQEKLPDVSRLALQQVNNISGFSPFVAMDMLHSQWYQHRQTWLNSWQAIRSQQRTPQQASDYWQKILTLGDFLYLSQLMLTELGNKVSAMTVIQKDISWEKIEPMPSLMTILQLQAIIDEIWQDRRQHIQDKLCYDKLMYFLQQH